MTGEGKIDLQTLHGKTVDGVAKMAQERGVPVIAFAGTVANEAVDKLRGRGIEVVKIAPQGASAEDSMRSAAAYLEVAARTAAVRVLSSI